ncbi:MAG TPA: SRPBCC family protein [Acidimicrobiales bacterium]
MAVTGEARVWISAAPGRVWSMVSDVTRIGEFSPEVVSCEWIDGATGPAVGARFRGQNKRGRTKWSTTCEVTACVTAKEFAFVTHPDKPATAWRYQFSPAAGGTEVTETFELLQPLGKASRLLTRVTTGVKDREADMVESMQQTLERLRAVAEAR